MLDRTGGNKPIDLGMATADTPARSHGEPLPRRRLTEVMRGVNIHGSGWNGRHDFLRPGVAPPQYAAR